MQEGLKKKRINCITIFVFSNGGQNWTRAFTLFSFEMIYFILVFHGFVLMSLRYEDRLITRTYKSC